MIIKLFLTVCCVCYCFIISLAEDVRKAPGIHEVIYNGSTAVEGQFPFAVRTLIPYKGHESMKILCGASLISPNWAVSAAHCVHGAEKIVATFGMVKSNDYNGTLSLTIPAANIFVHPKFSNSYFSSPDIVLYKLPEELPISKYPNIRPIAIAPRGDVNQFDGKLVTAIGWGVTETGKDADSLRYVSVKVMPNELCQKKFRNKATSNSVCTERIYNEGGPCYGDSGGPLVTNDESGGGLMLIGLTSFGVGFPNPCTDPNGGVVYTYLPAYADWIDEIVKRNN